MLVGLIGANIQGSISPALFAAAFAAAGIDGYYHLLDADHLAERRLPRFLDAIKAAGFAGANVTFPFKQEIIPLLDAVDASAAQVGAVNTVVIAPDGRTIGYNFDRDGWRNSFAATLGADCARGGTVVQIGAGGAGRAVAFALKDLDVGTLVIYDLDRGRAAALKADVEKHGAMRCRLADDLPHDIAAADGVVNATQVGMRGFPGNPAAVAKFEPRHWVADVIYTPLQTEFLKAASAKGARTLHGGGMCVHQAVEAFRQLTGITPDLAGLQQAFATALGERERDLGAVS
jgi:shikimate dehydrogenase